MLYYINSDDVECSRTYNYRKKNIHKTCKIVGTIDLWWEHVHLELLPMQKDLSTVRTVVLHQDIFQKNILCGRLLSPGSVPAWFKFSLCKYLVLTLMMKLETLIYNDILTMFLF